MWEGRKIFEFFLAWVAVDNFKKCEKDKLAML